MQLEVITQKPKFYKSDVPILFVHGMWHSAWCWAEKFMPYFAQCGYETHALSLRGHGSSEGNERLRWTSLSEYVDDVAQVVRQMESPPILVGHSMGGMILQKYLEIHEAPAAILLASAPPKGVLSTSLRIARRYPIPFLKANLLLSLYPVIDSIDRYKEFFYSGNISDEELKSYFSRLQDESFRAYVDMMFLNLPKPDRIKTRILVLGAEQDSVITPGEIKQTAVEYNAKEYIFPEMAHNMMLEPDWQSVADYIMRWINVELGLNKDNGQVRQVD